MATTTASRSIGFPLRAGAAPAWRHVDLALVAATISIAGLGVLMVYSASEQKLREAGLDPHQYLKRQSVWVVLGVAAMVAVLSIDYRVFRDIAPFIAIGTFG